MNDKSRYWIDLADYDFETAKIMLSGRRYLYVGFMCHQVIEKALKAYYASVKDEMPPYTHNLTILAKKSGLYIQMNEDIIDVLDILEPLNIEARYPTQKEKLLLSLNEEMCTKILQDTEDLFLWIKTKLS
ncbi:MAG: HEPN domain-containing protein [Syntrophomonas sp.]